MSYPVDPNNTNICGINTNENNTPNNATTIALLNILGDTMSKMMLSIITIMSQKGQDQADLTKNLVGISNKALSRADHKIGKSSSSGPWMTIIGILAIVIAVVADQPELAIIAVVLLAAQESGGMAALQKVIAQRLQADGLSKDAANVLAGVIITAIVLVVTAGASIATGMMAGGDAAVAGGDAAVAGGEAAATGGDAALTGAENTIEETGEDVANAAAKAGAKAGEVVAQNAEKTAATVLERIGTGLKQASAAIVKVLAKIPRPIALALVAGGSTAMSTGLAQNLALLIAKSTNNKEEQKKLELSLSIVFTIILIAATVIGGVSAANSPSAAGKNITAFASKVGTRLANSSFGQWISETFSNMPASVLSRLPSAATVTSYFYQGAGCAAVGATGMQAKSDFEIGINDLKTAKEVKKQGDARAMEALCGEVLTAVNQSFSASRTSDGKIAASIQKEAAASGQAIADISIQAMNAISA